MRLTFPSLLLTLSLHLPALISALEPEALPLVIWHGLGDNFDNPNLQNIADLYTTLYPSASTYIISLASSATADRTATFLGHVPAQIDLVCSQLLSLPPPFSTSRLNLLGFSQGGQFLRALVETCPLPHHPATLMTFGSQHNGIWRFLGECETADWACKTASSLLERNKWSPWAQKHIVPAQYFRDPADLDTYLLNSGFLADANNERPESRNTTYAKNLARLERFVMFMFEDDTKVIPKESSWFDEVYEETGKVVKLRDRNLYKEDWLGLKKLDKKGGLVFETMPGDHMQLDEGVVMDAFARYFSPKKKGHGLEIQGVEEL